MKKLFAIVMVIAVLFNSGGYDLFFQYLVYRSDARILDRINHSRYQSSDLVEIKVPVAIPAQAPQQYSDGYQAISGQIQVKNDKYDYAEIKITRDTLYLHVVPNNERTTLAKVNALYGKQVNDVPASNNSKRPANPLTKKNLNQSEYLTFGYIHSMPAAVERTYRSLISPNIVKPALEVGGQPPEA